MKNKYLSYLKNIVLPCVVYGIVAGVIVGTLVLAFKLVAEWLVESSLHIYQAIIAQPAYIPLLFVGLAGMATIMWLLHKWAPETKGGGIPRAEGVLKGILTFRWLRTAVAVVVNSFLTFFAGLPLGSEGPSVLLGTALGRGASSLPLSHDCWNRYIMTGGACAGFAVATSAPLTGIVFALEEAHKRFTPTILMMAMSAVVSATAVSNVWTLLLGHPLKPLFDVSVLSAFAMTDIWVVLLLGIAVGLVACAFNLFILRLGKWWDESFLSKIPYLVRLIIIFCLVGVVGLLLTDALFGGASLIIKIGQMQFDWQLLLLLFAVKFVLISLCTSSGATGGMFIPMLTVGALVGGLMANLCTAMGMSTDLYLTVVMLCMCAFMGASTRAPLTAMIFMLECTWQFSNMLYVAITVFIAYTICELLRVKPLYDVIMERMVEKQNHGKQHRILDLYYRVMPDCFAVGKSVRDILWPANTLVKQVLPVAEKMCRMDDDGEKHINEGDILHIQVQTFDEEHTLYELADILGKQSHDVHTDIIHKTAQQ